MLYFGTYHTDSIYENFEKLMVDEPKYEEVEGCEHEYNRTRAKFCQECGKPAYVEVEVAGYEGDCEEDGVQLFEDIMKRFNAFKDSFAEVGDF